MRHTIQTINRQGIGAASPRAAVTHVFSESFNFSSIIEFSFSGLVSVMARVVANFPSTNFMMERKLSLISLNSRLRGTDTS